MYELSFQAVFIIISLGWIFVPVYIASGVGKQCGWLTTYSALKGKAYICGNHNYVNSWFYISKLRSESEVFYINPNYSVGSLSHLYQRLFWYLRIGDKIHSVHKTICRHNNDFPLPNCVYNHTCFVLFVKFPGL